MEAVVGERKVWIDFQLQQFPCQLLSTVCSTLLKQEPLFKMSFNTVWTGVLLQWTCMIDWLIYSGIDIYKLWMSSHSMSSCTYFHQNKCVKQDYVKQGHRENCVDLNFVFQFRQISILCAIFFPFQQKKKSHAPSSFRFAKSLCHVPSFENLCFVCAILWNTFIWTDTGIWGTEPSGGTQ